MQPTCELPTSTWLSEDALRAVPNADNLLMDGGQEIPLRTHGPHTQATTMRTTRSRGQAYDAGKADRFKVGMDVNLILKEIHQNTLRHLCIDDTERTRLFADPEVRILAAAIADNTSIIALRISGCHATDVSLIPLYKALMRHTSIRSLDVSNTKGSEAAGKVLAQLICTNTQIVHVEYENVRISKADDALLQEALQFNAFNCQDPGKNPYDASLIRYIDESGKTERAIREQVTLSNPWMVDAETGEVQLHVLENLAKLYAPASATADEEHAHEGGDADAKAKRKKKRSKTVAFEEKEFEVHRQVCDDYMNGQCRYGSRCKYLHPERTSTTRNRIIAVRAQEAEEEEYNANMDDRTTVVSHASTATTKKLRGRTKASFKFDPKKVLSERRAAAQPQSQSCAPPMPSRKKDAQYFPLITALSITAAAVIVGIRMLL